MPAYEIALPPGAKNIKIKTSTQEIPVEPTFYRHSKDGAIPIVALFGGDEFVGEVLEGQWLKGDDGEIEGPFTAKINNGSLELAGRSDAAGTWRSGWITSKQKIPITNGCTVDVHLKVPSSTSSDKVTLAFILSIQEGGIPEGRNDNINVGLRVNTTTFEIRVRKRVNGAETTLVPLTIVNNNEGTFRFKFEPDDGHFHLYYHDGSGSVNEATDELDGSPFTLDSVFQNSLMCPSFQLATDYATLSTVSSDFIRVSYPDFKVVYDLDDSDYQSGNRGEVIVWDTMGSDNEDDWVRVFDPSHKFVGDCIIENGLVRFKVELETNDYCKWGFWNGSSWSMYDIVMPSGYRKARDFKLKVLTLEKVSVEFKSLFYDATDNLNRVEIRSGEPFIRVTLVSGNPQAIYYRYPTCRFVYSQGTKIIDDNLQAGWEAASRGKDNFILRFGHTQQFFVPEFREQDWSSYKDSDVYGNIYVRVGETVFIGVLDFPKYANLFKEAEDASLGGGATIDTTLGDDSGDSVVLDGDQENVRYQLNPIDNYLPQGRYIVFVRAKDTNHLEDIYIRVYNLTDSRYLNEENDIKRVAFGEDFAYYYTVFDVTPDDEGDNVEIRVHKMDAETDVNYIDYFLIVPIGNGESWPQDIAHNAMRTASVKYRVFRR